MTDTIRDVYSRITGTGRAPMDEAVERRACRRQDHTFAAPQRHSLQGHQRRDGVVSRRQQGSAWRGPFGGVTWSDEGYAKEELAAELGSAFLCADRRKCATTMPAICRP